MTESCNACASSKIGSMHFGFFYHCMNSIQACMTQRLVYKHTNYLKCLAWLDLVQEKLKWMQSLLHEVHTTAYLCAIFSL